MTAHRNWPVALFVGMVWLLIATGAGCRGTQGEPALVVYPTGDEQRVLKFLENGEGPMPDRQYANSLDHAHDALLARALPKPNSADLRRRAVAGIAEAYQRQTGQELSIVERERMVQFAADSGGFARTLENLASRNQGGFDRAHLIEAGLTEMLAVPGGPIAWLVNPEQSKALKEALQARNEPSVEKGALGLDLANWPSVKVFPDGPACAAGLRDGDVLVAIDGKDASTIRSSADAMKVLAGTAGQTVELKAKRGEGLNVFQVKRVSLASFSVRAKVVRPRILHLSIPTLEGSDVAKRVGQLLAQSPYGADWTILLDLRDNPGGRLDEANAAASFFLDRSVLEILELRDGRQIAFRSLQGVVKAEVIVLVNHNTGSSAEVVAMALRDNGRALILGEPTAGMLFGKDIESLGDGRMIVIRTAPRILSPTGRDYSNGGIPPDILVPDDRGTKDSLLDRAIEYAEQAARNSKTAPSSGSNERQ
jgi:C-terminal peptidase prc